MKARVARLTAHGGPEAISWAETVLGEPGPGEVLIRHNAVGLNYIDTYHRRGLYPVTLPSGLGLEAAGVVAAIGEGVTAVTAGDRVATMKPPLGAYATARLYPADALVRLPDDVDDETAAALLMKGCTAEFLIERCAKVQPGWQVLVHAAAGATGLLLTQWLKAIGAHVIGTVGSVAKAEVARAHGADALIVHGREDIAARVRALTGGAGAEVVFDGVGRATWTASLASCARRGLIVHYGNADGPVEGVNLGVLATSGSLYLTRPTLWDYYRDPKESAQGAARVFAMLRSGAIGATIGQRYPLEEAARAHTDLEARRTVGASLLIP